MSIPHLFHGSSGLREDLFGVKSGRVFETHLHSLLDVLIVVVEVDEHGLQHVLENGLRPFQRGAVEEYVNCLGRLLPDRILRVVEPFDEAGVQIHTNSPDACIPSWLQSQETVA